jgi:hypothetical protein
MKNIAAHYEGGGFSADANAYHHQTHADRHNMGSLACASKGNPQSTVSITRKRS